MKQTALFIAFILQALFLNGQPRYAKVPFPLYKKVEPERMINNIRDLASTAFEGRELGTDGNDKAVDWVSFKLEQTGVAPLFDGSFVQDFPITQYDLGSSNYFVPGNDSLHLQSDYLPAYYSTDAHIGADVYYAGYGLIPEIGQRLKHKIVVMHGLSREKLSSLKYLNPDTLNLSSLENPLFYGQALWAQQSGAAAVVFVPEKGDFDLPFETGAAYQYGRTVKLPAKARKEMRHSSNPYVSRDRLNIVVVYTTYEAGRRVVQASDAAFYELVSSAKKGVIPAEPVNRNVIMGVQLNPVEKRFGVNIAGILHGKFGSPYLLVSANLDQEGQHPTFGYPYLGANDNASGVAVLLELATLLQSEKEQPEYGIVFLIHNGAHRDLAGLRHFVQSNPSVMKKIGGVMHLANMAAGPILDSVSVHVTLLNTAPRFIKETEQAIVDYGYTAVHSTGDSYRARNLLLPFHDRHIPVYEISGGVNPLSNRISDVPDKLNYVKMYRMTQFSLELIWRYNYTRKSPLLHEKN
jgi:hypothetical protein